MGEALSKFVEEAQSLYAGFESATVFSIGGWNVSQYTLYMFLALILVLLIVLIGGRKLELIPHKKFTGTLEYAYEFISMVIRVLTLAVRLYGNMLAGHMILAVFSLATTIFLQTAIFNMDFVTGIPVIFWFFLLFFMYALETLVAFLQAYVFTILSSSYIGMAIHPH